MNRIREKHRRLAGLLLVLLLLMMLAFLSCKKKTDTSLSFIQVHKSIFEDTLVVTGVVQSVQSYTMTCPEYFDAEVVSLIKDGTIVKAGDVVCVLQNRELENQYEQLQLQRDNFLASLNKSKADLAMQYAMLDAQVKSINAQTEIANLDSVQLQFASPKEKRIKELELQQSAIEKSKLEKKLKALETINQSQIRSLELQLQGWNNRIQSCKDMLNQMTIKATQSGMAMRAISWQSGNVLQEGDQAWGSMPLVNIPDVSRLKVTITASEADYKRMSLKDSVMIRFHSMPGNKGWGSITKKAPVGKPVKEKSNVKTFEVEASIDRAKVWPKPGLSASCQVMLQRVPNVIVIPQLAIYDADSLKVVYVRHPKGYEERQVQLGAASPNNAVIVKGLSVNECISLAKPPAEAIKSHTRLPRLVKKKTLKKTHPDEKTATSVISRK
ncbi:MAG: hypothetical protein Q8914_03650 [Bacteroidota bacterium]|nr:hypothetical protein [Bacteroidota bacterium]